MICMVKQTMIGVVERNSPSGELKKNSQRAEITPWARKTWIKEDGNKEDRKKAARGPLEMTFSFRYSCSTK